MQDQTQEEDAEFYADGRVEFGIDGGMRNLVDGDHGEKPRILGFLVWTNAEEAAQEQAMRRRKRNNLGLRPLNEEIIKPEVYRECLH
jgi:hypothetical protein